MTGDTERPPRRPGGSSSFGRKPGRSSDGRPPRPHSRPPGDGRPPQRGFGGGRPQGGKRKLHPAQVKQAKQLAEQSGIPFSAAIRVVLGKTTLNDVLQDLLREEKIKKLIETHDMNRALATNIALGRTDLNTVLLRRRKNQTLQEHYMQSCLDDSLAKGSKIALAIHGHKKLIGKLSDVGKYAVQLHEEGTPSPVEVHKTQIKYAYDPEQYKLLRKFMGLDNDVKKLSLNPIMRARERHHFKNLVLQQSIDERREIEVVTLEGDSFHGTVDWFGRWEFALKFKGGVRVTLFRHAIYRVKLLAAR